MSGKKQKKVKEKVKPVEIEVLPEEGTTVPAVPGPSEVRSYIVCPVHVDVSYRHGGFCERCYGEETKDRIMQLDKSIDEKVLKNVDDIINRILLSDDLVMIERFLSRILKRFNRPETKHIKAQMEAVHLHGPIDFGSK